MDSGERARKVDAIHEIQMATPTNTTSVRQLVGMAQFYRQWIPAFSTITSPLTDMLKKGIDFATAWGGPQEKAVKTLKAKMTEYPTLRQLDPTSTKVSSQLGADSVFPTYFEMSS